MQMSKTKSKLCALFSLPQNFSRPISLYWRLIWQKTSVYPNIKTFSSAMHTKAIIFPLLSINNLFRKNFPNFKNPRSPPFIQTNVSQTLKIWPITEAIPNRIQNFILLLSNNPFSNSLTISSGNTVTFPHSKDSLFFSHNFYSKCE